MEWKKILKYRTAINANICQKKECYDMLDALIQDIAIDRYQDSQPGGGDCVSKNLKEQKFYEEKLEELEDINKLIPNISEQDVSVVSSLINKLEKVKSDIIPFENFELYDICEQSFEFVCSCPIFAEKEISEETIKQVIAAGTYIVRNLIAFDSNNEMFYRKESIKDSMDDILRYIE